MSSREIASAMAALGAESLAAHMLADPVLMRRYDFAVVRRGAMRCYSSTKLDEGVFNHVSGYGTFAPASQHVIDAVLGYYDSRGGAAHFEVLLPTVSRGDLRLLELNGFRDRSVLFQCHVRTTSRPPRAHGVRGLVIERVRRADAGGYGSVASRGFGDRGWSKTVFSRGWQRQIERDARVAAFIGSVDGRPAATGVTITRPSIAGLYSGSVLPDFRGRGIQHQLIAARVREGLRLGRRIFVSQTEGDNASAHNLHDAGFRTLYRAGWWAQPS